MPLSDPGAVTKAQAPAVVRPFLNRGGLRAPRRRSRGLRATHASLRATVADQAVATIGDALVHADHGKTAAAHYVGAAAKVPALRVMVGGRGG